MYLLTCVTYILFVATLRLATCTAHYLPDYPNQYEEKIFEKLGHHYRDHDSHSGNVCHTSHSAAGNPVPDDYIKSDQQEGLKPIQDYQYSDEVDNINMRPEEGRRQEWHKRSQQLAPFISLGALSNLPQFFEQLKGTMDKLEEQQNQQAQLQAAAAAAQAAEAERSFRPPATAAVLHAFRNYRPLRRTRSFPPALIHG